MAKSAKKASPPKDWHPADIKAALAKAGWSFNQLGLVKGGYTTKSALARALHGPYPRAERLIAEALGMKPEAIWPSRYDVNGAPNRPRGRQPMRPPLRLVQPTTRKKAGNPPAGDTST